MEACLHYLLRHRGIRSSVLLLGLAIIIIVADLIVLNRREKRGTNWFSSWADGVSSANWAVVTSINPPTEGIRVLSQMAGWKTVVVGDTKTPQDWHIPGVVFLDIKRQNQLGLSLPGLLPLGHFSRKNIGYLYAIKHGATTIYETDDDNIFKGTIHSAFHVTRKKVLGLVAGQGNLTFNPHIHFGQTTTWPRGYPLESIGKPDSRIYQLCEIETPVVQQGVVDGDPDMDAIFRLTRKSAMAPLQLTFDKTAPPLVYAKGTFAPYNAQNTLFMYPAFWSLFMPATVNPRVTDIWRAYWAKKVMDLAGQNLGFFPPSIVQIRSPHSYLRDFNDEIDLYQKTDQLVAYLNKWMCYKTSLFACALELMHSMADMGFVKKEEKPIVKAWFDDLKQIGYKDIALGDTPVSNCKDGPLRNMIFYPREHLTSFRQSPQVDKLIHLESDLDIDSVVKNICQNEKTIMPSMIVRNNAVTAKLNNILLVVTFSLSAELIPLFEALYRPFFPHILYCGSVSSKAYLQLINQMKVSYISASAKYDDAGCLSLAMKLNYKVDGFLLINEQTMLHPKSLLIEGRPFRPASYARLPDNYTKCIESDDCFTIHEPLLRRVKEVIRNERIRVDQDCLAELLKTKYQRSTPVYVPSSMKSVFVALSDGVRGTSIIDPTEDISTIVSQCLLVVKDEAFSYSLSQKTFSSHFTPFNFKKLRNKEQTQMDYFCRKLKQQTLM